MFSYVLGKGSKTATAPGEPIIPANSPVEGETRKKSILKKCDNSGLRGGGVRADPETEQLLSSDGDSITATPKPARKQVTVNTGLSVATPLDVTMSGPTTSIREGEVMVTKYPKLKAVLVPPSEPRKESYLAAERFASSSTSRLPSDTLTSLDSSECGYVASKEIQTSDGRPKKFERDREQFNNNREKVEVERVSQDDSGIGCGASLELLVGNTTPDSGDTDQIINNRRQFSFADDSSPTEESALLSRDCNTPTNGPTS